MKTLMTAFVLSLTALTASANEPVPVSAEALELARQMLTPQAIQASDFLRSNHQRVQYVTRSRDAGGESHSIEILFPWSQKKKKTEWGEGFLLLKKSASGAIEADSAKAQCACSNGDSVKPELEANEVLLDDDSKAIAQVLLSDEIVFCLKTLKLDQTHRPLATAYRDSSMDLDTFYLRFPNLDDSKHYGMIVISKNWQVATSRSGTMTGVLRYQIRCSQTM